MLYIFFAIFCIFISQVTAQGSCPGGYYCINGTPQPCPPGTYRGRDDPVTDCIICPPGKYCPHDVMGQPLPCPGGYYCSERTIIPIPCSKGNYCPVGFWVEFPCIAGTYAPETAMEECLSCPAGYYCPYPGTYIPLKCDENAVSEQGGTFCSVCKKGHQCSNGLDNGTCPAGGYCSSGIFRSCPPGTYNSKTTADSIVYCLPCEYGSYCRGGSLFPTNCPVGKYQPKKGQQNSLSCKNCPAGNYCPTAGLATPIPCRDGFICPAGTKDLGQAQRQCPEGSYCRGGKKKKLCPAGSYQDTKAQAYCKNCPVGYWCKKGARDPDPCFKGTYSNVLNITRPSKCQWCTRGMYCSTEGLNKPTGKCSMGFYCPKKSHLPNYKKCPVGHFCPTGASDPEPCPRGTYNSKQQQYSISSCVKCDEDLYCRSEGLFRPIYSIWSSFRRLANYPFPETMPWPN